jgi:hypothetical protein
MGVLTVGEVHAVKDRQRRASQRGAERLEMTLQFTSLHFNSLLPVHLVREKGAPQGALGLELPRLTGNLRVTCSCSAAMRRLRRARGRACTAGFVSGAARRGPEATGPARLMV